MDQMVSIPMAGPGAKVDTAEFLSAVGTFLAALTALYRSM